MGGSLLLIGLTGYPTYGEEFALVRVADDCGLPFSEHVDARQSTLEAVEESG